jgi:transposase
MLTVEEQYMIRHLREQGLSISAISRETGKDRKTVRKYLTETGFLEFKRGSSQTSLLESYKPYIHSRLEKYPTLSAIRLLDEIKERGFTGKYTIVKDYVRGIKRNRKIPAEYRFETEPGVQAQCDWGEVDRILIDGQKKTLYCFTMILGYSRMRYVEFTTDCTTETFIQCHINAFMYFGGITREILYDNTKNVVLHRTLKSSESEWNPLFEDFFRFYGFFPRLCKPGKMGAKTKGKVENLVKYVKDNFYLGLEYQTYQELDALRYQWMERVNRLPHGTTKIPPYDRLKEEKLTPFDVKTPYQITRTEYRKISKDCYISYLGNLYSVPWKFAGLQAVLRIQNQNMQVLVNGVNICEHVRREGSGNTVRVKEHFEGLLKDIMSRNRFDHEARIKSLKVLAPVVEKRPLVEYDIFCGGVANDK